jgi:hypothetical protein
VAILCVSVSQAFVVTRNRVSRPESRMLRAKDMAHPSLSVPIVYVYYVSEDVCSDGLPTYLHATLQQAVRSQSTTTPIYFIGNYIECSADWKSSLPSVTFVDTSAIVSERTNMVKAWCLERFQRDRGELWMTSALRFFLLEDFMSAYSIQYLLHLEGDNLLYVDLAATNIFNRLRAQYRNLAVTPLSRDNLFVTASVLWVPNFDSLKRMNNVVRHILKVNATKIPSEILPRWNNYVEWLRGFPHACCKQQGVNPDAEGMGIRPFAINEMSIMGYYRSLFKDYMLYLPVIPMYNYSLHLTTGWNSGMYAPGGAEVGANLKGGIWDPGSWGQYLGGTPKKNGRNRRFTDPSHIIGYSLPQHEECTPVFQCVSAADLLAYYNTKGLRTNVSFPCVTAPFVRCGLNQSWVPIINLHVHSKHTEEFQSVPCVCGEVI